MLSKQYYFIRHAIQNGASSFHLPRFVKEMSGEIDEPLSCTGRCQASVLAQVIGNLGVECIVSSNRKRTVETARILSAQANIPYSGGYDNLTEINFGRYAVNPNIFLKMFMSGIWPQRMRKSLDRKLNAALSAYYYLQWRRGKTTGSESASRIYERISHMLAALDAFPETRIAVVGHAGWISFLALKILGESQLNILKLGRVDNCSLTRIDADGRGSYKIHFFAKPLREFTGFAAYERLVGVRT